MNNTKVICLLLIFVAFGFLLRLNNISERSLWTDEFFTLFESTGHGAGVKSFLDRLSKNDSVELLKAQDFKAYLVNDQDKGIKDVTTGIFNTDTHPPLYFWMMNTWMRIFGDSVLAIRFFSVLMGLFAIILAYQVGNHLFGRAVANFCALFVSVCAFSVRYSQEARSYSLILALALLSWLFLLKFEKHNRNSDALWFAIFNFCGVYTHYFYVFIALAQFVYFTIIYRNNTEKIDKFYLVFLFSLLILALCFMPLIQNGYNFTATQWIFGYPGLLDKLLYLVCGIPQYFLILNGVTNLERLFLSAGLGILIFLVFRIFKEGAIKYPRQVFFCWLMFLLPAAGMFLIDIFEKGALLRQGRFWMFPFSGFIPLAGYLLNYIFLKNKKIVFLIIFVLVILSILSNKVQFGPAPKYVSNWINAESAGITSVVFIYNCRGAVFAQAYYLDDHIYLAPVFNEAQFKNGINKIASFADKVFIVRHYLHTNPFILTQPFMETRDINSGFRLIKEIERDNISVTEFEKCIL